MQIDTNLLITWGAVARKYKKNEYIFYEGDMCRYYHQIMEGSVRMCTYSDEGKVFIQGVFKKGQSFGEPPLFINERYPACALAVTDAIILILTKESLLKILEEYPELQRRFLELFAKRIFIKANTAKHIISQSPEHRIKAFLDRYKQEQNSPGGKVKIPYTRQEIANFTGLRVETVIRTTKKMSIQNILEIKNRKLYY
ncbi:MAG: Crp/Fnr family transcriptional regulator [Saprospiraceae bacterium]